MRLFRRLTGRMSSRNRCHCPSAAAERTMMTASGTSEREVAAMACGDPIDPMDSDSQCSGVLRDVWLFLDDEMDAEARARVQQHLDECSPCLVEAGLDRKLKELLHRKCGGDRAPEQLRARVIANLQGTVTTVRVTRGPA